MSTRFFLLFALLSFSHVLAVRELSHSGAYTPVKKECILNRPKKKGTVVSGKITVVGPGKVVVSASSEAKTVEASIDSINEAVKKAVIDVADGADVDAVAKSSAKAVGEAMAEAYVAILFDFYSNTQHAKICIESTASAQVTANALATAIVEVCSALSSMGQERVPQVLAEASNAIAFSRTDVAVTAISAAAATAFAEAELFACSYGVIDQEIAASTISNALAEPLASIFAVAYAAVSGGTDSSDIEVKVVNDAIEASFADGSDPKDVAGNVVGGSRLDSGSCSLALQKCTDAFRYCCDAKAEACRCGDSCAAVPAALGNGTVFGYSVTEGEIDGFGVGSTCFCRYNR